MAATAAPHSSKMTSPLCRLVLLRTASSMALHQASTKARLEADKKIMVVAVVAAAMT
jgi:hypothetical protein